MTTFAVGSLVAARGREWVVLPDSSDDFLVLRPLGGTDDDIAAVVTYIRNAWGNAAAPVSAVAINRERGARVEQ